MAKYCDSAKLEENWFHWLLAIDSPELDIFRSKGLLWTRVLGFVDGKNGVKLTNPSCPEREHYLALKKPLRFRSVDGKIQPIGGDRMDVSRIETENDTSAQVFWASLVLRSASSSVHIFEQDHEFETRLKAEGFVKEIPASVAWHSMLADINNICIGIATKFKQGSDEETNDLANEALSLVTIKLKRRKLVYIPGKAPVFNLLTTTIYRCIYSILNKRKNQREGFQKLVDSMQRGRVPNHRSFRLGSVAR